MAAYVGGGQGFGISVLGRAWWAVVVEPVWEWEVIWGRTSLFLKRVFKIFFLRKFILKRFGGGPLPLHFTNLPLNFKKISLISNEIP